VISRNDALGNIVFVDQSNGRIIGSDTSVDKSRGGDGTDVTLGFTTDATHPFQSK
jgi:hypothetical protein